MKLIRKILYLLLLLFIALCLMGVGYYYAVTKNTFLQPEKLLLNEKSVYVYDARQQLAKNVDSFIPKQTVDISAIPLHTKQAFIDVEDKRFYSHHGFDVRRIAKAALNNLKSHSYKEGASTISQQLIKNTHLTQEKTVKRKLREWKLTNQLEKRYTKEEILEIYLNNIYFGHSCFGIRSASDFYFNKTPQELSLADSAILAGLVKSPNNYSPFKNPTNCQKRKESVLRCMLKNESITQKEKQSAINEALPIQKGSSSNKGYLHFVFDELSNLSEKYNFPIGGKVEIYSYLDSDLQTNIEEILQSYTSSDKSALILDNATCGFKACVSTIGNIERLPGSLIKPLLVFAPALEEGLLSPATPILDDKINYGGYAPENYDGIFHGYVSARECVEKSLNIPAVKILSSLGVKKGANYLESLSMPIESEDFSLALALGGMKKGYTLKQLVSGFSSFANQGLFQEGNFIQQIKINGGTVYKRKQQEKKVFSSETAYLMTDMLKSTAKQGTAKKLRSLPFDVAAKTGTVGTKKGNTDAYALSYTVNDTVGVWIGNRDNRQIESTGGGIPCNLLLGINEYLYNLHQKENTPIPTFPKPKKVISVALDKTAYYDTHTMILADKQAPIEYKMEELFHKDFLPTKQDISFTSPTVTPPTISLNGGIVTITLNKSSPSFYRYKVEKYYYVTQNTYVRHSTFYIDEGVTFYQDTDIAPNTQYVYAITPVYKETEGKRIVLPTISTKQPNHSSNQEQLDNWWEY